MYFCAFNLFGFFQGIYFRQHKNQLFAPCYRDRWLLKFNPSPFIASLIDTLPYYFVFYSYFIAFPYSLLLEWLWWKFVFFFNEHNGYKNFSILSSVVWKLKLLCRFLFETLIWNVNFLDFLVMEREKNRNNENYKRIYSFYVSTKVSWSYGYFPDL